MKTRKGLTRIEHEGTTLYNLYNTVILADNGKYIKLNTNGWKTRHTKNCMNDNLPEGYRVFQRDFEWYVTTPKGTLDYTDEMVLTLL